MIGKLIGVAVAGVGALILLPAAFLVSIVPSGGPTMIQKYQTVASQLGVNVDWMDVYMYDYTKNDNDFQGVTSNAIQSSFQLFYYRVKENNPKWDPKLGKKNVVPQYIYKTVTRSLEQVMLSHGYTFDQYKLALNMEQLLPSNAVPANVHVTVPQLQYQSVSAQKLYDYVHMQGSIFTISDIETIMGAARRENVNPALMVAITGQEESFVPAAWPDASRIRNNPFNVYVSWQDYNTNLADAAQIAANTLAYKLSIPPPDGENPIAWINDSRNPWGIYATDLHWSYGVADILAAIESYLGTPLSK